MKKLFPLIFILLALNSFSQAPQSFKYQATARDNTGDLIKNQQVGMQISIIQGSANGDAVYVETFNPTTDDYGLININIGTGETDDDFSSIQWSTGSYFINIGMDVTGGTNYQDFGTSQLLSVPYALFANNAATSNYSFNPSYPNGFQNITPLTFSFNNSSTYTVPEGKILYILNLYSYIEDHTFSINGIYVAHGKFNTTINVTFYAQLSQPLIADENDIISAGQSFTFNGYLISK